MKKRFALFRLHSTCLKMSGLCQHAVRLRPHSFAVLTLLPRSRKNPCTLHKRKHFHQRFQCKKCMANAYGQERNIHKRQKRNQSTLLNRCAIL